jgi:hypothetical protein
MPPVVHGTHSRDPSYLVTAVVVVLVASHSNVQPAIPAISEAAKRNRAGERSKQDTFERAARG